MENLMLFGITVTGYFMALCLYFGSKGIGFSWKKFLTSLSLTALLCVPFNVGDNIFTVLGNAKGENVYALFSLYQNAKYEAFSLLNIGGYQRGGRAAATGFGAVSYQYGGNQAVTIFGLSGYQRSTSAALTFLGVALLQKVGTGEHVRTRSFAALLPLESD